MQTIKTTMHKVLDDPTPQFRSVLEGLSRQKDPVALADTLMNLYSQMYPKECLEVLQSPSIGDRLQIVLSVLEKEKNIRTIQRTIARDLEGKATKEEREVFLREHLKMIRKELGLEADEKESLITKYRERLQSCKVPKDAQKLIDDEISKLQTLEAVSSEYTVTRNYLDWLTSIPWGLCSKENFDLAHATKVLDEDHYGLKDVKDRILEFIAVGNLRGSVHGKIICMIGPPGVGKTSIGKSIARALGRQFFRFSVGGMVDVAEIKGHRRTYVGAIPGKLIQCLKQCRVSNPVVLIDEIDKLGRGYQGDPASALLEVLDPEQNKTFMDHYLDTPVDLSNVLFVCTANQRDTIPKPLLDRMEVIQLSGYIPQEQMAIVRNYLIPTARKDSGLLKSHAIVETSAIHTLVHSYCRDAGVRNLQKHVEKIFRKVALKRVQGKKTTLVITGHNLHEFVGKPVFATDKFYVHPPAGVVMGLAWTQMGGASLYVETVVDPQVPRAELRTTGQMGEVMKESTIIAYTYAKNHFGVVAPDNRFFESAALHMHIPEGATPKDGPSAGVTMVTSLLSLALDTPILKNLAMTGELTLTGKVLPIGGIREKTIAARRSGVKVMAIPLGNKKDWEELPEHVRHGITIHYADYYSDIFTVAFPTIPQLLEATRSDANGKRVAKQMM